MAMARRINSKSGAPPENGGDLDLRVVHPKYAEAAADCGRFVRALETMAGALATSPAAAHHAAAGHLAAYIARLRTTPLAMFLAPDLAALYTPTPVETADEYAAFTAMAAWAAMADPAEREDVIGTVQDMFDKYVENRSHSA